MRQKREKFVFSYKHNILEDICVSLKDICVSHTAGCGVPDTTPAPEK